jgi:hypothetical protein
MNSAAKQISPVSPRCPLAHGYFILIRPVSEKPWKSSRAAASGGGICRSGQGLGKAESWAWGERAQRFRLRPKSNCACAAFAGSKAVVNGVWRALSRLHQIFPHRADFPDYLVLDRIARLGICERHPFDRQINQAA